MRRVLPAKPVSHSLAAMHSVCLNLATILTKGVYTNHILYYSSTSFIYEQRSPSPALPSL